MVYLDPVAVAVGDVDLAVIIHMDRHRTAEPHFQLDVLDGQLQLLFDVWIGV